MKKRFLFTGLLRLAMAHFGMAQTGSAAQLSVTADETATAGKHQLQVTLTGFDSARPAIKAHIGNVTAIPGIVYFNIVVAEGASEGHFDLRFNANGKTEYQQMLKQVFCKLNIQAIKINQTTFQDCQQIIVP